MSVTPRTIHSLHDVVDISSEYSVIRKRSLPLAWHRQLVRDAALLNREDSNGTPLPNNHVI